MRAINFQDELYHHGIKGQKWGVRRYQNADGTLTSEGKSRYNTDSRFKRKIDRKDNSWIKKTRANSNYIDLYNKQAREFNKKIKEINSKYDGKNLLKTPENNNYFDSNNLTATGKKYMKEILDMQNTAYKSISKEYGSSPSGRYELELFVKEVGAFPAMKFVDKWKED